MTELLIAATTALWLGILTSISPCPLATNIAAVSFISRKLSSPRQALVSGLLYALGRTLVYVIISVILVASILSVPQVSLFLQRYMNAILGPLLIVVGMFMVELLELRGLGGGGSGPSLGERVQQRFSRGNGMVGSLLLGGTFALAFCPLSAALFFGSLIPLALRFSSMGFLPAAYGLGTALPVIGFSLLLVVGVKKIGAVFNKITVFERKARLFTGLLFIMVGLYFTLKLTFQLPFLN